MFASRKVFDAIMSLNPEDKSTYETTSVPEGVPSEYLAVMFKEDVSQQTRLFPVVNLLVEFYFQAFQEIPQLPFLQRRKVTRRLKQNSFSAFGAKTVYLSLLEKFLLEMKDIDVYRDFKVVDYNEPYHPLLKTSLGENALTKSQEWSEQIDSLTEAMTIFCDEKDNEDSTHSNHELPLFRSAAQVLTLILLSSEIPTSTVEINGMQDREEEFWLYGFEPYRKLLTSLKALNTDQSHKILFDSKIEETN